MPQSFPDEVRRFVESVTWTFAKTYATTWPHEYIVRMPETARLMLALAHHIFEYGVEGRLYSKVFKYHHDGGKVYWCMDPTPEATDLINGCDEDQTYEARLAAGTLPGAAGSGAAATPTFTTASATSTRPWTTKSTGPWGGPSRRRP
jgi:hypothetical protein